jgi:hypothetical protein
MSIFSAAITPVVPERKVIYMKSNTDSQENQTVALT